MNRELITVIEQIGREKGIDKEILFEALESALLSASKKTMGPPTTCGWRSTARRARSGSSPARRSWSAVDRPQARDQPRRGQGLNAEAELERRARAWSCRPRSSGASPPRRAKQVILQRVRDAERDAIYSEFIDKEGQIVRGVVHRIEKRNVILEIGKAEAVLTEREQIPGERYNPGDRMRAYVLEVRRTAKGPQILLSRTHPGFLVAAVRDRDPRDPEGIVLVKAAAREAGERAKVAVASTKRDVDPIGACVGLRGTRIQVISRELRGEKIDIVEWSHDPATFVARALSPAKVSSVTIARGRRAEGEQPSVLVIVPDNQLSLAIGKKGQNARLAAKLTGMRIDIKSEREVEDERAATRRSRARARSRCSALPGVDAGAGRSALVAAGLGSPGAHRARPGVERARRRCRASASAARRSSRPPQAWVAEHARGRRGARAPRRAPDEPTPEHPTPARVRRRRRAHVAAGMSARERPKAALVRLVRGADGEVVVDRAARGGAGRVRVPRPGVPGARPERGPAGACVPSGMSGEGAGRSTLSCPASRSRR